MVCVDCVYNTEAVCRDGLLYQVQNKYEIQQSPHVAEGPSVSGSLSCRLHETVFLFPSL